MLRALTLCCLLFQTPALLAEPIKTCERLWAHRGYTLDGAAEGSVEAAQKALQQGAGGTEVDILWVAQQQDFIVAHDWKAADAGPEISFNDWLTTLPADYPLWVDAKNYGSLWPWQVSAAAARLHTILEQHQRLSVSIVESRNPWYLGKLEALGVHTMYRTDLKNHSSDWQNQAHAGLFEWLYTSFGPFSGISTDRRRYHGSTATYLSSKAPIYLSTAKAQDDIGPLLQRPEVRVILTDTGIYQHPDC